MNPWRRVVWIARARPGVHGGQAWSLVLECGHLFVKPHQKARPWRRLQLAPRRVRCLSCGLGTPGTDPWAWIRTLTRWQAAPPGRYRAVADHGPGTPPGILWESVVVLARHDANRAIWRAYKLD